MRQRGICADLGDERRAARRGEEFLLQDDEVGPVLRDGLERPKRIGVGKDEGTPTDSGQLVQRRNRLGGRDHDNGRLCHTSQFTGRTAVTQTHARSGLHRMAVDITARFPLTSETKRPTIKPDWLGSGFGAGMLRPAPGWCLCSHGHEWL